ncbi:MAG: 1-acyl-sn-glycerol-3-phosphate acyltransferase [Firmicutes bacterium]|nr:1-acyl-sn-glycerol-3-phosphate acyltransferase [Bacillota bacterium]
MKEQEFDLEFYKNVRSFLVFVMKFAFRPEVIGIQNIKNEMGVILAGNHISMLDIPLLISVVNDDVHFMAKNELFENKLGNYIFSKMGSFPINRNEVDLKSIKTALRLLKEENILGIFPEGTRNKTNAIILPFREGATRLAIRSKKPIIPFGISGKYRIGGGITIRFGEAIDFNRLSVENHNEYLETKVKELIYKN